MYFVLNEKIKDKNNNKKKRKLICRRKIDILIRIFLPNANIIF